MTTLLIVGDRDGSRRCDAKCYAAAEAECDCVCGGRNHGAGKERAMETTQEMAAEFAERFGSVELAREIRERQLALPV